MLATFAGTAKIPSDAVEHSSVLVIESTQSRLRLAPIVLTPGKWTIGSAVGCKPRLEIAGVQPRHCLIMAGDERTLLKAWSARTWLNDEPTKEAVLKPGDRLLIGPVEFLVRHPTSEELLQYVPAAECVVTTVETKTPEPQSPAERKRSRNKQNAELAERQRQLAEAEQRAARTQQDLAEQYARLESDRATLDAARQGLEVERRRYTHEFAELRQLRRELDRRCEELEHREAASTSVGDDRDNQDAEDAQATGTKPAETVRSTEMPLLTELPEPAVPDDSASALSLPAEDDHFLVYDDDTDSANAIDSDPISSEAESAVSCDEDDRPADDAGTAEDFDSLRRPLPSSGHSPAAEQALTDLRGIRTLKGTVAAVALCIAAVLLTAEVWGATSYSRSGWAAAVIGVIAAIEAARTTLTIHRLSRAQRFTAPIYRVQADADSKGF
jgi:hypothetical protein